MKIVIYTLTRDRLEYTQRSFQSLRERAGMAFEHLVIDNGSADETPAWLAAEKAAGRISEHSVCLTENRGISIASNLALEIIFQKFRGTETIIKMDNDCLVRSPNLLTQVAACMAEARRLALGPRFLLSPAVTGINRQPFVSRKTMLAGMAIGLTAIVGGLFHCVPASLYQCFRYDEQLPMAKGQDDELCRWWKSRGGEVGYIEGLTVEHMDGTDQQAVRYPEYFERKWVEEKTAPPWARKEN